MTDPNRKIDRDLIREAVLALESRALEGWGERYGEEMWLLATRAVSGLDVYKNVAGQLLELCAMLTDHIGELKSLSDPRERIDNRKLHLDMHKAMQNLVATVQQAGMLDDLFAPRPEDLVN